MTATMRLLIADRLRRMNKWMLVFFAAFAGGMWLTAFYFDQPSRAFGTSMWLAAQIGPQMTLQMLPPPLWYLPVRRRDVWRAGWLISVIAIPALSTIVKLIALLVSWGSAPGLASIALSALFDVVAAGAGCTLIIAAMHPRPSRGPFRRPAAVIQGAALIVLPLSGPAFFYLSQWGIDLPTRWTALSPPAITVLTTALALTIATWFYVPSPRPSASRATPQRNALTSGRNAPRTSMTGLPRLLMREAAWTLGLAAAIMVAVVVFAIAVTRAWEEPDWTDLVRRSLRAADGGAIAGPGAARFPVNLLIWYGFFVAAMAPRFGMIMRHLRALPIGATRLNAILVAWPAAIWGAAWTATTLLHLAVLRSMPPGTYLAGMVALTGVCAMAQATMLSASVFTRMMVVGGAAGLLPLASLIAPSSPAVLTLIGLIAAAGAVAMNRAAFSRSATYRPQIVPIGPMLPQNWK